MDDDMPDAMLFAIRVISTWYEHIAHGTTTPRFVDFRRIESKIGLHFRTAVPE